MRKLLIAAIFATSALSLAQQPAASTPPEGSNWQHVEALPAGANIHVKAQHSSATCKVKSVDADSLTCTRGKDLTFQRTEVKSITIPRRGRSSLIGLAIGGGAGAITGFALGTGGTNTFFGKNAFRGLITGIFAVGGGAIGAGVGVGTDFAHSMVYKAP
jgi:hypothetical protein